MELTGKHGTAIVYTDDIEQEAISQIINLINQPMAEGADVRIMPDCHAGAGCVIGYTAKLTGKVVPNLIGVDIGCGVSAWPLGNISVIGENFDKLDKVIRTYIPSGRNVRDSVDMDILSKLYNTLKQDIPFDTFSTEIKRICKEQNQDEARVWSAIGSLGGGNHFIEIDKDDDNDLWLVIHSGSRNFGLKIAEYHQSKAEEYIYSIPKEELDKKVEEIKKTKKGKGIEEAIRKLRQEYSSRGKANGLEYLEGEGAEAYFRDMNIAQIFAQLSRRMMAYQILKQKYKMDYFDPIESVHNYINFQDGIMRKGAISAHEGEEVIIPLNMADGIVIGIGKGNPDWNFSAPHGAGRKMSRSKAKATIDLVDFEERMNKAGVWSSCVGKDTIDEAPQAYKNADKVISYLQDTIDVKTRMFPVYNFKASE